MRTKEPPQQPSSSASPLSNSTASAGLVVDELPEALPPAEAELTRVDMVLQAELIRGRLEAHGIGVRLTDTHTAGLAPHLGVAIGGVRVIVASDDLEAARAILEAPVVDADDADEADADTDDSPAMGPAETAARWALWSALLAFVVPIGGQVGSAFMVWRALSMGPPIGAPLSASGRRVVVAAVGLDVVAAALWAFALR